MKLGDIIVPVVPIYNGIQFDKLKKAEVIVVRTGGLEVRILEGSIKTNFGVYTHPTTFSTIPSCFTLHTEEEEDFDCF